MAKGGCRIPPLHKTGANVAKQPSLKELAEKVATTFPDTGD